MYDSDAMKVMIYSCNWNREDGPESSDLLRQALKAYRGESPEKRGNGGPEGVPGAGGPDAFTVCRDTEHGKPYVKEFPDVHFSVSHDGGVWACAVSGCEVGLDLQKTCDRDTTRIAERFFHPTEIAWLAEQDSPEEFFRIWAKKESYVKYTGTGLAEGLRHFSVVDGLPAFQQEIRFREGYFMVLTTARPEEVVLKELPGMENEADPAGGRGKDAGETRPDPKQREDEG